MKLSVVTEACLSIYFWFLQMTDYVTLLKPFLEKTRVRVSESVYKRIEGLTNFLNSIKLVSALHLIIAKQLYIAYVIPQIKNNNTGHCGLLKPFGCWLFEVTECKTIIANCSTDNNFFAIKLQTNVDILNVTTLHSVIEHLHVIQLSTSCVISNLGSPR